MTNYLSFTHIFYFVKNRDENTAGDFQRRRSVCCLVRARRRVRRWTPRWKPQRGAEQTASESDAQTRPGLPRAVFVPSNPWQNTNPAVRHVRPGAATAFCLCGRPRRDSERRRGRAVGELAADVGTRVWITSLRRWAASIVSPQDGSVVSSQFSPFVPPFIPPQPPGGDTMFVLMMDTSQTPMDLTSLVFFPCLEKTNRSKVIRRTLCTSLEGVFSSHWRLDVWVNDSLAIHSNHTRVLVFQ